MYGLMNINRNKDWESKVTTPNTRTSSCSINEMFAQAFGSFVFNFAPSHSPLKGKKEINTSIMLQQESFSSDA